MQSALTRILTLARREVGLLAALLVVALLVLSFGQIADEMIEGQTADLDHALLLALRNPADLSDPIGPAWIEEVARDITALGSTVVLSFLVLAVTGYLIMLGKRSTAWLILGATLSGTIISTLLKMGFDRPRPDLVPHATEVFTASFPSGHATLSAVTFLTLGAVLTRTLRRRPLQAYILAVSMLLTVMVGLSRVYLGVHYPTDVLAGWCIGAAWAILCWSVALRLQQRGSVDAPGEPAGEMAAEAFTPPAAPRE